MGNHFSVCEAVKCDTHKSAERNLYFSKNTGKVYPVQTVLHLVTLLIKSFTLFFILKYIAKLNLEHSKKLVVVVHAFQKTQKLIVKEMYRDLFIVYMHSHCAQKRDKRGSTRRVSHCSTQRSLCHCFIREF